ncbi:MAG: TRAM domain-containing protein, partial [Fibrella sp.]|nr:TRAM domain-containing protein [Armatimonadota bacterium]
EYDKLAPGKDAVDSRLVRLAKAMNGSIVTNDFNLNKVASLEGVSVLNINELANCLKTVVLPGEELNVTIVKHGREPGQGVGYLDDGTMVVVENARRKMGETLPVMVQSVMQTQAGKMVFAHISDEDGDEDTGDAEPVDGGDTPRPTPGINGAYVNGNTNGRQNNSESVRAYTGGRTRRPVR